MSAEKASIDFHYKIEHYKEQYESMDAKIEVDLSFIKVFNGGELVKIFFFSIYVTSIIMQQYVVSRSSPLKNYENKGKRSLPPRKGKPYEESSSRK